VISATRMSSPCVMDRWAGLPRTLGWHYHRRVTLVVIGLGANLGDPERQLRLAVKTLHLRLGQLEVSSLYRSEAVGPVQPDFLNAAAVAEWPSALEDLLALTQELERQLGRRPSPRWGPRHVDLDILWAEGRAARSPELVVPHPELTKRAFALLPLLELLPDAVAPGGGPSYRTFLPDVRSQRIERCATNEWWEEA
jgi:2-amino-4-hydroxy-6-hydroxymethyldihydropteridine diphosphokinase